MSKTRKPARKTSEGTRILVVEDSPTQAQALGGTLEAAGCQVVIATNGDEALRRLEDNTFDLVVSDVVMPGDVNGYELCRRIKAGEHHEIPVVLFTSLSDPLDIIRGLECGADNFFTKSHGSEHLLQRIKLLLETRQARAKARVRMGVKILFLGREFTITSDREQIIDLLMSTFEDAVVQNQALLRRETELARSHQSLQALYELAVGLSRATTEAEVLETALYRALELPGVRAGWIVLREGESGFRLAAARNLPPALQGHGALEGDCLCRRLILSGDLHSATSVLECERLQRARGDTGGLRYHASIPLWVGDRTTGVMNLVGAEQGLFSDQDLKVLHGAGNQIAVALERARLQAGLEKRVEERTAALTAEVAGRARSEHLLRASEERYRLLFEGSPLPTWVVDVETLAFLAVNPAALEHYGYSEAEFLSMTAKDIRPPEDVPGLLASFSPQHLPAFRRSQWRHRKKDGTLIDVEVAAHSFQFRGRLAQMVIVDDITERKRAEAALRASEAHIRTILENIGDGVLVLDQHGRHLDANPRACELSGYSREELLRLTTADTYAPQDRAAAVARLGQVVAGGEVSLEREMLRKDGSVIIIESDAKLLPDGRLLATIRDVTERRRLERQLLQAQKMEAVGRLAGGVAHDFNNILTAILGYADLLAEALSPGSAARADLDEIHNAAKRAEALTRQLLAFSRQQVLQPVVLNLNEVVENLERMLHRILGEDVALETSLAPDLGNVKADAGQIEQVILNLAVNARDAMPTGGKLTIETANAELDEAYADTHAGVAPGQYVLLAVSDNGVGMNEATKARIFEPFFTTKAEKGTGLGLATVHSIVNQSGGHIWLYSEPAHGATFKVYLPLVDAPAESSLTAPATPAPRGTETVLLTEDDDMLRQLARTLLTKLGYDVLEAKNGKEALTVARGHRGQIHLLVTDVVLPGESGLQVARHLLEDRPDLRVLYMSGYTDEAIVRHGLLERGVNYLQKPFSPAALARKVREVLDAPPVAPPSQSP